MKMRGSTASTTPETDDFALQLTTALKQPSDDARAMLAQGRSVTYRERDIPPGRVILEHPDGTKEIVTINLVREVRSASGPEL